MIPRASVSATRIQEVLGTDPSVVVPAQPVRDVPERGRLELRGVGFHYPGAEHAVLSDISFTTTAGTTGAAGTAPAAAPDPCAEAIAETRDQAIDRLDEAYDQLIQFDAGEVFAQPGDAPDPEQERIRRTLQRSFHTDDLAYVEVIRRRLLHMASTLRASEVTVSCSSFS